MSLLEVNILLFPAYLVLSISGIVLMKLGADAPLSIGVANKVFSVSAGGFTLLGLLCYICSFLLYTRLIATNDISYLVPITSAITQVVTIAIALLFFREQITVYKAVGIALAVAGVVLMSIKR